MHSRSIAAYLKPGALLTAALCGICNRAGAQHRPISPAPQTVTYGSGSLPLAGLQIRLVQNATDDDRFSAKELATCITNSTETTTTITEGLSGAPNIFLDRTGDLSPLALPGEKPGPASREAYSIEITSQGAQVRAQSTAGIFYGVQTLCQMIEHKHGSSLPEAQVTDWPGLAYRGTMVDMSEGPLLQVQEILRQIDLLARWKMNQYYFYNEATITLDGLPPAAPETRISKSSVREIIAYARQRHIDVVPCLELYGHLHDLFRREEYSALADFPHGVEFNPEEPRVSTLISQWAAEYSSLFSSPFVHIGFDETWQLMQAARQNRTSPTQVFIRHLQNVSQLFQQQGKTVLAWADIMVKYPNIVSQLPPGIIAVPWFYDPRPDKEYKRWLGPLVQNHIPYIVAPGVNGWSEIAPDYTLSFDNIDTFIAAGRASGTLGVMNTIWSDDVQMLKRPSWPGIAYGGAAAWQEKTVDREHFFSNYAALEYPPGPAPHIALALQELADSESSLQEVLGQNTMIALWHSPFTAKIVELASTRGDALHRSRLLAESAERNFLQAVAHGGDEDMLRPYIVECRLLDYAGLKFQYGVEILSAWKALGAAPEKALLRNDFENIVVSQQHGKIPDLMEMITELKPEYERSWGSEYTKYRMGAALGRWDAEYEYWRRLQDNLQEVVEEYDPKQGLPPFPSLLPRN
jgi:hexosaminidase